MKHQLLAYTDEQGNVKVGILDNAVRIGSRTVAYICNVEGEIEQVDEDNVLDWQKEKIS